MSESRKLVTYDFTKLIKDVEVSTAFIPGLQNVYYRYLTEFHNAPEQMGNLITKFNQIIDGKLTGDDAALSPIEHEIYTIFSLTNLLKSFAKKQNLEKLTTLPVNDDKLKEFAEDAKKKGSLPEALEHLANKIKDYKEEEDKQSS
tara:strand:+ start:1089 stop:1523 length:435 start_codon:yes stop_codon:yes gene_type:complete